MSTFTRHAEPVVLGSRHQVAEGETLYSIARANNVTPEELAKANRILNPKALRAGDTLFIPRAGESPTARETPIERPAPDRENNSRTAAIALRTSKPTPAPRADAKPAPALQAPERRDPLPTVARPSSGPRGELDWPIRGVLYARFGKKGKEAHDGVDLSAPLGTPVQAAAPGKVLFAGEQKAYGKIAIIQHSSELVTLYAHCNDLRVKTGQQVREGQVVATVGESGRTSGPHLHFEVRRSGRPVDPLPFLEPKTARSGGAVRRKVR